MDFKVNTSPINGALLIVVQGEFDMVNAKQVQVPAELAISARRPVLLDLSQCDFIDSTGLRLVLHTHEALTQGEGPNAPMAVVASTKTRKLFSVTAIDLSVPVFATRDEALESLGMSHSGSHGDGEATSPSHHSDLSAEEPPT